MYISAFLGLLAHQSLTTFEDEEEKFKKVAFAFTPTRTAVFGGSYNFEQTFLFPQPVNNGLQHEQRRLRREVPTQRAAEAEEA